MKTDCTKEIDLEYMQIELFAIVATRRMSVYIQPIPIAAFNDFHCVEFFLVSTLVRQ